MEMPRFPTQRGILPLTASQPESSWLREPDLFCVKPQCWHSFLNSGWKFPRKFHWCGQVPKTQRPHIKIPYEKLRLGKGRENKDETLPFVLNVSKGGFGVFFSLVWRWVFFFWGGGHAECNILSVQKRPTSIQVASKKTLIIAAVGMN